MTEVTVKPPLAPEAKALMKGVPGFDGKSVQQTCMTSEAVEWARKLEERVRARKTPCSTSLKNTASSQTTELVCPGATTRSRTTWRGDTHYEIEIYNRVTREGLHEDWTHITGDFVKADCGTIKPAPIPHIFDTLR